MKLPDFLLLGSICILYGIAVYYIIKKVNVYLVKKNNKIIERIENINNNYKSLFYTLDTDYEFEFECNSLQKYKNNNNNNSIFNYLSNIISNNQSYWQNLINLLNQNKILYQKYKTNIFLTKEKYSGLGYKKNKYIFLSKKII